jgi:DNA-binding Xre family transcriptional regulator
MLGKPGDGGEPAISKTPPAPRGEPAPAERVSTSRYPKPKILMGEVAAPRLAEAKSEAGQDRDAFRAFMIARRLSPTEWARAAGIPQGELLAFLTGRSRGLAAATREKLARAIDCPPGDLPR